jgi:peptide/nickel transport system permease protein
LKVVAKPVPGILRLRKALGRQRTASAALLILGVFSVAAIFADFIVPYPPSAQDLSSRLLPPGTRPVTGKGPIHVFGTDYLGRDVLSRVIAGARVSMLVATVTVVVAGSVGVILGMVAGYYGGTLDAVIVTVTNIQLAFPFLLLAITLAAFVQPSLKTVIAVLAVTTWAIYARVSRAKVLSTREQEFIEASRALGAAAGRILYRHVLPNMLAPALVIATLEAARAVILESTLSFLGVGVPPPIPTWGGMLAEGRRYMLGGWWLSTFPGLAVMVLVLSINVFGDFLRDYLDPRLRAGSDADDQVG